MERTNIVNTRVGSLKENLRLAESRKKYILDYSQKLYTKYVIGEISHDFYIKALYEKYDGKTLQEWINFYDSSIQEYKKQIHQEKNKQIKSNLLFIGIAFIIIIGLIFFISRNGFNFTGFAVQEERQTFIENLNLDFSESAVYNWQIQNLGQLISSKISGIIKGNGNVKIYIDDILLLDRVTLSESNSKSYFNSSSEPIPGEARNETSPFQEPLQESEKITEFFGVCENSCDLSQLNLNKTSYILKIEIENAQLTLDKIEYEILSQIIIEKVLPVANETINKTTSNETSQIIPEISEVINETISNISKANLTEINITVPLNITEPVNVTNQTELNQTEISANATFSLVQSPAKVGEPVKWTKKVNPESFGNLTIDLPEEAENISVKKTKNDKKETKGFSITGAVVSEEEIQGGFLTKFFASIGKLFSGKGLTGFAVEEDSENQKDKQNKTKKEKKVRLNVDEITEYQIEYETPAPTSIEQPTERGKKIVIGGPENVHYQNVLAFTTLDESLKITEVSKIKIYWTENNTFISPSTLNDTNQNGIYDYVEWIVPHLSNQTFEIIVITHAEHLDANKNFISDIYGQVKALDGNWSKEILSNQYVRVIFEQNLTSSKDITIFPKIISGTPRIEVYEVNESIKIAEFTSIKDNEYNKVYLKNLSGIQDTFDLKIVNGSVKFDHIVDPGIENCVDDVCVVWFNASGSDSWVVPTGVTTVQIETWGGGGSGAGRTASGYSGGGGGGAYAASNISVSPTETLTIQVGARKVATTGNGAAGNPSYVSRGATQLVYAAAGSGGTSTARGAGGTIANSNGTTKYAGGGGYYSSTALGGGGGCAGSTGAGGNSTGTNGGIGTGQLGGTGGAGVANPTTTAGNGSLYGGGGGGVRRTSGSRIGGSGGQGFVRITYTDSAYPIFADYDGTQNNTTYTSSGIYIFNVTITDTNGTAWLQFNEENYTATNTTSTFNVTLTSKAAGAYAYLWWAYGSGSTERINNSGARDYTIAKAAATAALTNDKSWTRNYDGTPNTISYSESNTEDNDVVYKVYQNEIDKGSSDSVSSAGTYNYILNTTGGENYSSSANLSSDTLVINKIASSINTFANNLQENITIPKNSQIYLNVTTIAGDSGATLKLYRNSTLLNQGASSLSNLTLFDTEGFFNITGIYEESENYTGSSESWFVTVIAANTAPTIPIVETLSSQTPIESNKKSITFYFTAEDADGASNLNDSSARVYFQKAGETTRYNESCLANSAAGNQKNYSCTVNMWYFDKAGTWTVNASVKDVDGTYAENSSTTFNYETLTAMIISPASMSWPSNILSTETNVLSTSNPLIINNTGNDEGLSIEVTARDLRGLTDTNKFIFANNFSIQGTSEDCAGNSMMNSTSVAITGAVLQKGNNSLNYQNATSGQQKLFFCLKGLPTGVSAQAYSSAALGSWAVRILLVAIIPLKKRKQKKVLNKNNKILSLAIKLTDELKENYSSEKGLLVNQLVKSIREEYGISKKEILKLLKQEQEIPITIFSKKLGALESIIKYLKENLNLTYHEISQIIGRDERTVWTAYHKASEKQPGPIIIEKTEIKIPLSQFGDKNLTVLEFVITYLKKRGFRINEIAKLLERDQRNIWLINSRAAKKLN